MRSQDYSTENKFGSDGMYQWYINRQREVVCSDLPVNYGKRQFGATWAAEELPHGHEWHQREAGRYLFTPHGEVHLFAGDRLHLVGHTEPLEGRHGFAAISWVDAALRSTTWGETISRATGMPTEQARQVASASIAQPTQRHGQVWLACHADKTLRWLLDNPEGAA